MNDTTPVTRPESAGDAALGRMGELFESAAIGLAVLSADGLILKSNPAFNVLIARADDRLEGTPLIDLVAAEDSAYFARRLADLQAGSAAALDLEHRFVGRDGTPRWVRSMISILRDAQGQAQEIVMAVTDLQAKVAAEEAREDLFEHTNDLIQSIAADGAILYVNRAWRETLGYAADEVRGLNIFQVIAPESVPHCSLIWERLMHGENVGLVEMVFAARDGRRVALQGNLGVRLENGQAKSTRGIFRDVSEAKEARDKLSLALAELGRRNADLKQFTYIAAHDLQEPLRAIAGFSKLLSARYQGHLDQQGRDYLDLIVDGAERMKRLLDDLLTYTSTVETELTKGPLDSGEALDEALRHLATAVNQSGALITRDELPVVRADRALLVSLFQNLLSNALKFCGEQVPTIHISATREDQAWRFSVRDQGIGFSPEFSDRIFGLFQRLHTREKYSGTGLGLAICQQVVERHGGRIWAESTPGRGATFHFTLAD